MSSRTRAIITQSTPDWQVQQAQAVTDPVELARLLDLEVADLAGARRAEGEFPLRVPRSFVARMEPGNPRDPLLRQVLASGEEMDSPARFGSDPLEESAATPVPGILHKYPGRALLMVTGACAVHCRYCFRRHFPYPEHTPVPGRLDRALEWLAAREDITEVILSGGDPLSVTDRRLGELLDRLASIRHLRRLRVHSRSPVMIPERITPELVGLLGDSRWQTTLVLHANHARELAPPLEKGVARLREAGVWALNQAVLLAGINDTLEAQQALSLGLFEHGILPYYLHQLDPVAGAAHFEVPDERARELHGQLRASLPGYLVPTLVRETPGEAGKMPV